MFLEACGKLDEPSHSHPPKREFWVHPFNAEHESSKVLETFYKNIRTNPETFFACCHMSFSSFDELKSKNQFPASAPPPPQKKSLRHVLWHQMPLWCTHTYYKHAHHTYKPRRFRFLSRHAGARCGSFLSQDLNFYYTEIAQKNHMIWTVRFNIICCDKQGDFMARKNRIVWTSTKSRQLEYRFEE